MNGWKRERFFTQERWCAKTVSIIASLCRYYDRLIAEGVPISRDGWAPQKITHLVHLNQDGTVKGITSTEYEDEIQLRNGKTKKVKHFMTAQVPIRVVRSSNIRANFFYDNSDYIFGIGAKSFDGNNSEEVRKAKERFEASRELHHMLLDEVESPIAKAILNFFDIWDYKNVRDNPYVQNHAEIFTGTGVFLFCLDDETILDDSACANAYDAYYSENGFSGSREVGTDIITGEHGDICRIHPKIMGIPSISGSGAPLCTAKHPSCWGYGRRDGYSAPMTEKTAFKYVTALKYLASAVGTHSFTEPLGGVTILFWSETASEEQDKAMLSLLTGKAQAEITTNADYIDYIRNTCFARPVNPDGIQDDENPIYHIIGVDSRNGYVARIKFEFEGRFEEFAQSVIRHYDDCRLDNVDAIMTPYRIMSESLPHKADGSFKDDGGKLYNNILSAIVHGDNYPEHIIEMMLDRINKEQNINAARASFLKAALARNYERSYPVSLDKENTNVDYIMGRLLALGDDIQYAAMSGKFSKSLSQRYMQGMMCWPAQFFPVIETKIGYYLEKLGRWKPGLGVMLARQHTELLDLLPSDKVPAVFTTEQRSAYTLGVYQQRAEIIRVKREKAAEKAATAKEATVAESEPNSAA